MSDAAKKSDKTPPPVKDKSTVILLFTIAADTTWRMFVPIIGGTIGGVWADNTFATKPLWTIVGVSVGVVVAALLVRAQLRKK